MNDKQNSFENNLERLQKIVDQLESGELALEQGVSLYKEGLSLTASCRKQLDEARLAVSQVTPEGLAPFDANASEEK
ncbi:exodeoxyribonuclease VII small subunit [Fundidesulfovibrio terrae]|uniref:exodeoxyribonuclease VII small subunit n=1 Tax=Fundidesulfovibrio terrae TaxID=2922866 RepID=UPI001FAE83C5|nr:exodeoxyribonuclease VII small subunit [Fundidesulfovibrio terrae]